jgi:asparagine synthase (glutamine-hydrolysing)
MAFSLGKRQFTKISLKRKKGFLTTIDLHSGNSYESPIKRPQRLVDLPKNEQSEQEIVNHIEDLLTESILKRNIADVPIGILLNGGYDNATVAAVLQKNQNKRIKTYTVGIEGELHKVTQAKKIAEHLKTNHQDFFLDRKKVIEIVKNYRTFLKNL